MSKETLDTNTTNVIQTTVNSGENPQTGGVKHHGLTPRGILAPLILWINGFKQHSCLPNVFFSLIFNISFNS